MAYSTFWMSMHYQLMHFHRFCRRQRQRQYLLHKVHFYSLLRNIVILKDKHKHKRPSHRLHLNKIYHKKNQTGQDVLLFFNFANEFIQTCAIIMMTVRCVQFYSFATYPHPRHPTFSLSSSLSFDWRARVYFAVTDKNEDKLIVSHRVALHTSNNKDPLIDLWAKFIAYYTSLVQIDETQISTSIRNEFSHWELFEAPEEHTYTEHKHFRPNCRKFSISYNFISTRVVEFFLHASGVTPPEVKNHENSYWLGSPSLGNSMNNTIHFGVRGQFEFLITSTMGSSWLRISYFQYQFVMVCWKKLTALMGIYKTAGRKNKYTGVIENSKDLMCLCIR